MGAHFMSNLCNLICLRHLFRSRRHKTDGFSSKKRLFLVHACATCSEFPSNISTNTPTFHFYLFALFLWNAIRVVNETFFVCLSYRRSKNDKSTRVQDQIRLCVVNPIRTGEGWGGGEFLEKNQK